MVGTKGKRGCIGNGRTLRATPAHKPHIQEVLTIPTAATFTVMMSMATLALPLPKTGERIDQQSLTRFEFQKNNYGTLGTGSPMLRHFLLKVGAFN